MHQEPTSDTTTNTPILFNPTDLSGPFAYLANAARYPFKLGMFMYTSVAHCICARQFQGKQATEVRYAQDPYRAVEMIKKRGFNSRHDWDTHKHQILCDAITAKFKQNPTIRILLLDTEDREIVDTTDKENRLGKLLMFIREKL